LTLAIPARNRLEIQISAVRTSTVPTAALVKDKAVYREQREKTVSLWATFSSFKK
jgi:hypothetical protein